MKALVFHGPGLIEWTDVPEPWVVDPTDAVIQVDTTTISRFDLHILRGDVPGVAPGRVLGHEAVGTVVEVGLGAGRLEVGDRVIVNSITGCGICSYCRRSMASHCLADGATGWALGRRIDGTQAEYVRVPYAETSTHRIPTGVRDEQAIFCSDVLTTGFEVSERYAHLAPTEAMVVIGAGPVGLATVMTAGLHGASTVIAVDTNSDRLRLAKEFGATHTVNSGINGWEARVFDITEGLGVEVAVEAAGIPKTFNACTRLVRPGGRIVNIGTHGRPIQFDAQDLWEKNITITMGLVDSRSAPVVLKLIREGRIPAQKLGTHFFALDRMLDAYTLAGEAAAHRALKTVIKR